MVGVKQRRVARAVGRATRRRGQELEDAILRAAWRELLERGYAAATMEGVAERAGTSRPVISRRWPTKRDLVLATIRHQGAHDVLGEPDTGSLRADLVALLDELNTKRAPVMMLLGSSTGDFLRDTGLTVEELRALWLGDRDRIIERVIGRAVVRGEVAPERVTPRTVRLSGDLLRLELLMTMRPASAVTIRELVDEVILPVLTGALPVSGSAARAN